MKKSLIILLFLTALTGFTATAQNYFDSMPPTITILGADTLKWEVFTPFKDPGVMLRDNHDSDSVLRKNLLVTSNVNINKTDTYQIQYNVKDLAGNAAKTKIRTVMVIDTVKPVITLKGNPATEICRTDNYRDQGYVLTDNYDKVASVKITTEGTFKDTKTLGLFTLRYIASDSHKNIGYSDYRYILVEEWGSSACPDWGPLDTIKHSTGIENQNFVKQVPRIFPNPASEKINIEFRYDLSGSLIISLSDIIGRQMNATFQTLINNKTFQISTSNIPNGIYFLNIQNNKGNFIQKIEIRH